MANIKFNSIRKRRKGKTFSIDRIRDTLKDNHAGYVLITCSEPSEGGKMTVEMSYDGDHCLASYLVDSAHNILEDQRP